MLYLAYGVNLFVGPDPGAPQGAVSSLQCHSAATAPAAELRWVPPTRYRVNPGVSLDLSGSLVSATGGRSDSGN